MEKTLSVLFMIVALVLGLVCGVVFTPSEDLNCPACEACPDVPECEECAAVSCNTPNAILDTAVEDVLNYLEDEDELICDSDEYDRDEVSIKTVYDGFSIEYDDDEYTVAGSIKLNFKEDDERRCRDTFDFEVFYEEGEDPEVTIF